MIKHWKGLSFLPVPHSPSTFTEATISLELTILVARVGASEKKVFHTQFLPGNW